MGAAPIGAPGWPEFAFWTASIERVRIVSMASRSRSVAMLIGLGSNCVQAGAVRHRFVRRSPCRLDGRSTGSGSLYRGPRYPPRMPLVPRPGRPHRPARPARPGRPRRNGGRGPTGPARIVVVGDLMLDVVLLPERALESGTDVPGRVALVQGGSAANTARWLARL